MKRELAVITIVLGLGLAVGLAGRASAQGPQCGALSTWNGRTCVGPKGKAYCPVGMTLQGLTCVAEASPARAGLGRSAAPAPVVTAAPVAPGAEADEAAYHQRILAMLTTLTTLVTAQGQQIADNDKLTAQLFADNVTMNVKIGKMETLIEQQAGAIQSLQAALQQQQAAAQKLQASLDAASTYDLERFTTLNNASIAINALVTDVQHRQAIVCHMVDEIDPYVKGETATARACNGTYWYQNATKTYLDQAIPFKY
jgi:hypothetical protein